MGFADLGLSDALLRAVGDSGYDIPTPIQQQAIPSVLMGRDIIGVAQTGTGKTASFVLPMIDILAEGRSRALMPRSLILEPTRELAQQVSENFDKYGKYHKLSMALLIGGVSMGDQLSALEKGVDVLIATPGRLMDLFGRGKIMLGQCNLLVIDEADRMLDMGFIPDIEEICTKLPAGRQTLLFSATMPPPIKKLADRFMSDPKMVEVARPASTNKSITQWAVRVQPRGKREALRHLLSDPELKNAIIFCNRKRDIKELVDSLRRHDYAVSQIHGDMDQSDRVRELERFKSGDINVIVASDVAARGLDIPGVSHVFNYDVPHHAEDYVHRIGRTGRAGRTGTAYTLVLPDDAENLADVEKLIGQKVPVWGESKSPAPAPAPAKNRPEAAPAAPQPAPQAASQDSSEDEAPARRRRTRGGRGRRKDTDVPQARSVPEQRTEQAQERAPEQARPASRRAAGQDESRNSDRNTYRDAGRNRDTEDGPQGPGFGEDGMPDFMRRPATLARS